MYFVHEDGRVIAGSALESYGSDLLDLLVESGVVDSPAAKAARTVLEKGGEGAFLCGEGCKTDNLCAMHLPGYDYTLIQTFPKNVTQAMVRRGEWCGGLS